MEDVPKEIIRARVRTSSANWKRTTARERGMRNGSFDVVSSIEIIVTNDLFMDDIEVIRTPLDVMEAQITMALDIPTIRLLISPDGLVNTMTWPVQSGMVIDPTYDSVDALPKWMQLKLATLMLLDANEPNKKEVEGVGRRISENVYWIYLDGGDTGKESEGQST